MKKLFYQIMLYIYWRNIMVKRMNLFYLKKFIYISSKYSLILIIRWKDNNEVSQNWIIKLFWLNYALFLMINIIVFNFNLG